MKKCNAKISNKHYSFEDINELTTHEESINKEEDKKIVSDCIKETDVTDNITVNLFEKIGAGTYGFIYSGEYINKTTGVIKDVAIKKIIGKITANNPKMYNSSNELDILKSEVEYSIYMEKKNIGPKIYDSFYIIDEDITEVEPNYYVKYILLFIIMDKYEYSLESFLMSNASKKDKEDSIKISMDIIKKQVYDSGLYCIDIKPRNFVVNSGLELDVKMIDFGEDYCKSEIYQLRHECILNNEKNTLYLYNLLQLYMLLVPLKMEYVVLNDEDFKKYFIIDKEKNKNTIIQVFLEGSEQKGDQCHLVWHYSSPMYNYFYKSKFFKDFKNIGEKQLSIKIYDALYHYLDNDYSKKTPKKIKRTSKKR